MNARTAPGLLLWALVLTDGGCGVEETGIPPPNDALYFPVGLGVHPDGRYLYVANADFDRRYNAGTVSVYDTFGRRILAEATVRTGLFAGEIAVGRLSRPDVRVTRSELTGAAGGPVDYTLELRNAGSGAASDLGVELPLPASLTDVVPGEGGARVGAVVRWRVPELAAGVGAPRATLTFTGVLAGGAAAPVLRPRRIGEEAPFDLLPDGEDADEDGVANGADNCPFLPNVSENGPEAAPVGAMCAPKVMAYVTTRDDNRLNVIEVHAEDGDRTTHLRCDQGGSRLCGDAAGIDRFFGLNEAPDLAADPYAISLDSEGLMLTHLARGVVSRWGFDAAFRPTALCTLTLPGGASSIARHPQLGWAYVSDRFGQIVATVETLDPHDRGELGFESRERCRMETRNPISVDPNPGRGRTRGLAFSADGTLLYVASSSDASLRVYDTSVSSRARPRHRLMEAIPLGNGPNVVRVAGLRPGERRVGAALDGGEVGRVIDEKGQGLVYISAFDDDRVIVVDPLTLSVVARIKVGAGPHDIVFMPDGAGRLRAYVATFSEHRLAVIDLEPGSSTRFTHIASVP